MHILCQDLWNSLASLISFKEKLRLNNISFMRVTSFDKACISHRSILRHTGFKDVYKMYTPVINLS